MNRTHCNEANEPQEDQALFLQQVVNAIVKCCEDRRIYENQKFGLPYTEIRCLLLFQEEEYLTVNEIAYRLDVAKSRGTKLVRGLLDKGLVERAEDPGDNRVKRISPTEEGREKIREVEAFHKEIHKDVLSQFDAADRSDVLTTLESLHDCMETVKQGLLAKQPN
ncbi:MAG: MarR family transcriptional regulator [Desulfohalobiaceae bacterium]